ATPDQFELRQYLQQTNLSLTRFIKQHLQQQRKHLQHVSSYYKFQTPTLLYDQQIQKRDDLEKQLNLSMNLTIKNHQQQLQLLLNKFNLKGFKQNINREQITNAQKRDDLSKVMNNFIQNKKNNLARKLESLNNLSPTNTMLRGYTIVNKDDNV
ncbi:exodeoxyribonuclease VII large subunit, partial [Mammaliicoccus sciuri]